MSKIILQQDYELEGYEDGDYYQGGDKVLICGTSEAELGGELEYAICENRLGKSFNLPASSDRKLKLGKYRITIEALED